MARVSLNVSGTVFEFDKDVLKNELGGRLAQMVQYQVKSGLPPELAVDRHPGCFAAILNFFQTGELHIPHDICPRVFKREMEFWEIEEHLLADCCMYRYNKFFLHQRIRATFARSQDDKQQDSNCISKSNLVPSSWRAKVWKMVNFWEPSIVAKVYFGLVCVMTLVLILTIAYMTEPSLRRKPFVCEQLEYMEHSEHDNYQQVQKFFSNFKCSSKDDMGWKTVFDIDNYEWAVNEVVASEETKAKKFKYLPPDFTAPTTEITGSTMVTDSTVVTETTDSTVVMETTDSTVVMETTDSAVVTETTDSTVVTETTDSTVVTETTDSTVIMETTDSTVVTETTDSTVVTKTTDSTVVTETTDSTAVTETTDSTVVTETTDSTVVTETTDSTVVMETTDSTVVMETTDSTVVTETPVSTVVTETPDSTVVTQSMDSTVVTETTDSTVVMETTDSTVVTETTDSKVVTETTDSTVVTETTDSTAVTETIDSTVVMETTDSTVVTETTDSTVVTETLDSTVVTQSMDSTVIKETTDVTTVAEITNSRMITETTDSTMPIDTRGLTRATGTTGSTKIIETTDSSTVSATPETHPPTQIGQSLQYKVSVSKISVPHRYFRISLFVILVFFAIDEALRLLSFPSLKLFLISMVNVADTLALLAHIAYLAIIGLHKEYYYMYYSWVHILLYFQFVRVFRIFRIVRNTLYYQIISYSIKQIFTDMFFVAVVFICFVLAFSLLFFIVEAEIGTQKLSIPVAWYWAVITLCAIGHSDFTPTSGLGQFVSSLCAIAGMVIIALVILVFINRFISLFQLFTVQKYVRDRKSWGQENENLVCTSHSDLIRKSYSSPIFVKLNAVSPKPQCVNPHYPPQCDHQSFERNDNMFVGNILEPPNDKIEDGVTIPIDDQNQVSNERVEMSPSHEVKQVTKA